MALTIPESARPAFEMLLHLPDEQMQTLLAALTALKPARTLRDLAQDLSGKLAVGFDDLYELVKLLGFLT